MLKCGFLNLKIIENWIYRAEVHTSVSMDHNDILPTIVKVRHITEWVFIGMFFFIFDNIPNKIITTMMWGTLNPFGGGMVMQLSWQNYEKETLNLVSVDAHSATCLSFRDFCNLGHAVSHTGFLNRFITIYLWAITLIVFVLKYFSNFMFCLLYFCRYAGWIFYIIFLGSKMHIIILDLFSVIYVV